jgi:3-phosphoshikimate 1-carboxyvinyltransferase
VDGPRRERNIIQVGAAQPAPFDLAIPGDLSSAAFLLAAAALVPASDLMIEAVGLNPTRTAFLDVLQQMGVTIDREALPGGPEPVGEVRVRRPTETPLAPVTIGAARVPGLIDELPLIGVLATQADGVTEIRGASELRVKESDRIAALTAGLRSLGADIEEFDDGFAVRGPTALAGGPVDPRGDHRLAMAFAVAALGAKDSVHVEGIECVADSFPGFLETLGSLRR